MDELQFREVTTKDIRKCAEITADAWFVVSNVMPKEDVVKFWSAFINLFRTFSTRSEVALISGNIVGLLFGRIDRDYGMKDKFKLFFSVSAIFIGIITGKYGRVSKRFTFLRKLILTEIKVLRNNPKSDGEVTLFVVDSKYRGKGIGRILMDRFLDAAKKKNAKVIVVNTGQRLANWKFYEIYGFKRYGAFHDDLVSYVMNEDAENLIYTIDLR